jgi:hypothetical protein
MKFPCPYCHKELDFMELSHDSDLFAIIKMLNTFGKHSALVAAYTELFGLTPLKSKTKKWRVLLEEMKRLFDSESFTYQKRTYRISQAGIAEALNVVVHRNFTDGLDSHNYLKKIMITVADREERDAGRRAEKDLRKKENGLMSGSREVDDPYPQQEEQIAAPLMKTMPAARMTPEQLEANRKRLKTMIKGIV